MRKTFLLVGSSVIFGLVMGVGVLAVVAPSQAVSKGRSICVDTATKELKLRKNCRAAETFFSSASVLKQGGKSAYDTWLELGNKGTKQDFINSLVGPRGASGSSGSSGRDFLSNCFQKREAAISAGARLAARKDREAFERATGCIVEDIKNERFIEIQSAIGYPVITDWTFIASTGINAGVNLTGWGNATYEIEIANYDAVSIIDGNYNMCIGDIGRVPIQISSGTFLVETDLYRSSFELTAGMELGTPVGQDCVSFDGFQDPASNLPFRIHVDPEGFPQIGREPVVYGHWGW